MRTGILELGGWRRWLIGSAAILAVVTVRPSQSRACGGFFCDQPGGLLGPLPIAQTGENVLFAVNPTPPPGQSSIEAHIQIFYSGPASQFSWILPVDAAPTLDTGSDTVFNLVAAATNPSFQVTYSDEGTCRPTVYPPETATGAGGSSGAEDAGVSTGVVVVFQGAVGPYDAAVIHGPDATEIEDWLSTNGYFVSDQAKGIIETYVSENKYFVALKLMADQGTSAIRPIILRFDAQSPCIPLRLTAIAAASDMRVNLWVLAPTRTVPQNYLELTLNLAKLDWLHGASNYGTLLSQAADEAGGNAFITEYAGTARIMDGAIWKASQFDLDALRGATTPPLYLNALVAQSVPRDAGLLAFLEKYIPEPQSLIATGVSETTFYNLLSYYYSTDAADFTPFDSVAATDGFATDIVAPLQEAQALFDGAPYLTRLSTFISPPEMTKDPLFLFNPDLGDVSATHEAQAVYECGNMEFSHCNAPVRLTLPDGSVERLLPTASSDSCFGQSTAVLPAALSDAMPSLATAWQRRAAGTGILVTDNTAVIANVLNPTTTPPAKVSGGSGCGCAVGSSPEVAAGSSLAFGLAALLLARRRCARRP